MPRRIDTRWWRVIASVVVAPLLAPSAAGMAPVSNEPQAKILVDAPMAAPLSRGTVVVRYRTENLHLVPVFGPAALQISPRVGHLHVSIDDAAWVWMDASGDPWSSTGCHPDDTRSCFGCRTPTTNCWMKVQSASPCPKSSVPTRQGTFPYPQLRRLQRRLLSIRLFPSRSRAVLCSSVIARRTCNSWRYLGPRQSQCPHGSGTSM